VALAAGNYFVQATNTTTNCKSPITAFAMSDTHVNPAITAATTTNNTNCTGTTANGLVTINVNGAAPAAQQAQGDHHADNDQQQAPHLEGLTFDLMLRGT
jgi:hypothetical protein